jgi:hypothetical protein
VTKILYIILGWVVATVATGMHCPGKCCSLTGRRVRGDVTVHKNNKEEGESGERG